MPQKEVISEVKLAFYIDESVRTNARRQFQQHFNKKISSEIESGLYCFSEQYATKMQLDSSLYEGVYDEKLNDVVNNLENGNIVERVAAEGILPYNLPYMSPSELDPENWEREINRLKLAEDKVKNMATTDRYPCGRCGARKATVKQLQTRSCDEPMTTFITCQNCGNVKHF